MFKNLDYVLIVSVWSLELWERKRMCENRKWNKIYTGEGNLTNLEVFAERSDGARFSVLVPATNNCLYIKLALDQLESYRTCDCQTNEACIKHPVTLIDTKFNPNHILRSEIR